MSNDLKAESPGTTLTAIELREWMDSLDHVIHRGDPQWVAHLLESLRRHALLRGIKLPFNAQSPYVNTIGKEE